MKQMIILCALIFVGCSSKENDWDTGATRQQSDQQERMEETSDTIRNQNPEPVNAVRSQPF
jgi:PBP1b-binding outer membrane lipoprotein LpoB